MIRGFRSRILHVVSSSPLEWQYLADGVLLIEDGTIRAIEHAAAIASQGFDLDQCVSHPDDLLVPGFIDAHVHAPQIDVVGGLGTHLLDWLEKYTFPAEIRFSDGEYAAVQADRFLDMLLKAGTTTAMVYATSHFEATDKLFEAAASRNMRFITGKLLMDEQAPVELLESPEVGIVNSRALIERWHGRGRLGYAISPRYAGTCTPESLKAAANLFSDYPNTWIQTHLAENVQELKQVLELHPEATDYLHIYEQQGLLTERSLFGHCIHLSDDEIRRLQDAGGRAIFCPSSNLFLGSGLFDLEKMRQNEVVTGIGSDVGAGTSLSLLQTLGDAYKVCQLADNQLTAMEAFSMATLGNAEALHLESSIGNLMPGKDADFLFLNPGSHDLLAHRIRQVDSIEEEIGLYVTLGDDRVVRETFVAGESAILQSG
jgi:guanine deaminase